MKIDVIKAFLNERGFMMGEVFVNCELEVLRTMYVWREGRLLGWLKRNEFEHLPNSSRAAVVCVVMGRNGVKVTRRDVVWAGKLLKVLEEVRVCGGCWVGKGQSWETWMKRQMRAYDAAVLPARYRHVVEVLGKDGVWDAFT